MTTYAGTNYQMRSTGAFILSRTPDTLIQTLQVPCFATAECVRNDQIVIQAGQVTVSVFAPVDFSNNLVIVTASPGFPRSELASAGSFSELGVSVDWYLGLNHKALISTPEGISVIVASYYSLMSVSITAPLALQSMTSGLCGAFNRSLSLINEFMWRPCLAGRTGQFCDILDCPGGGPNCSQHGDCLPVKVSLNDLPVCNCYAGFGGPDCSQPICNAASVPSALTPQFNICSGIMRGSCSHTPGSTSMA